MQRLRIRVEKGKSQAHASSGVGFISYFIVIFIGYIACAGTAGFIFHSFEFSF